MPKHYNGILALGAKHILDTQGVDGLNDWILAQQGGTCY